MQRKLISLITVVSMFFFFASKDVAYSNPRRSPTASLNIAARSLLDQIFIPVNKALTEEFMREFIAAKTVAAGSSLQRVQGAVGRSTTVVSLYVPKIQEALEVIIAASKKVLDTLPAQPEKKRAALELLESYRLDFFHRKGLHPYFEKLWSFQFEHQWRKMVQDLLVPKMGLQRATIECKLALFRFKQLTGVYRKTAEYASYLSTLLSHLEDNLGAIVFSGPAREEFQFMSRMSTTSIAMAFMNVITTQAQLLFSDNTAEHIVARLSDREHLILRSPELAQLLYDIEEILHEGARWNPANAGTSPLGRRLREVILKLHGDVFRMLTNGRVMLGNIAVRFRRLPNRYPRGFLLLRRAAKKIFLPITIASIFLQSGTILASGVSEEKRDNELKIVAANEIRAQSPLDLIPDSWLHFVETYLQVNFERALYESIGAKTPEVELAKLKADFRDCKMPKSLSGSPEEFALSFPSTESAEYEFSRALVRCSALSSVLKNFDSFILRDFIHVNEGLVSSMIEALQSPLTSFSTTTDGELILAQGCNLVEKTSSGDVKVSTANYCVWAVSDEVSRRLYRENTIFSNALTQACSDSSPESFADERIKQHVCSWRVER